MREENGEEEKEEEEDQDGEGERNQEEKEKNKNKNRREREKRGKLTVQMEGNDRLGLIGNVGCFRLSFMQVERNLIFGDKLDNYGLREREGELGRERKDLVRGSQRLLQARVLVIFSGHRPYSLVALKVSSSARSEGSLPASGGSKRSEGSLPASGGSKRSQGSLPHRLSHSFFPLLKHYFSSPMAGGKRSRQEQGSSSKSKADPCFLNVEDKASYTRYTSAGITVSKIINPVTLSYPVMNLFAHTSLTFLLTLTYSFNPKLLYQFFASLRINSDYTSLQSYLDKRPVEISYKDLEEILHLSTTGDKLHNIVSDPDYNWSQANQFLRNTPAPFHVSVTSSLGKDARIIQHVLQSSIIPKAGDRIHITPLLSLTTFYIMACREFNASDLFIRYIENLTTIRNPGHHRKPNLALGHIIFYVLTTKYNLGFPSTSNSKTIPPTFFTNNSFHILHSTHLHPEQGEAGEEEEEALPEQAQQQQFQSRVYEYMDHQQQQHTQDRAWLAEQFDLLRRFHPPPPPPRPDGDDDPFLF
ncbi:hypothetical protein M5K25_001832 [Dendrobium thyrsiflorum]|uniref:Uncharacterized protein n=1 Tax=Dendrobium thyrsiflorum TaxID=117978 RepID=A0ABD0VR21_DENTH